MQVIYLTLIGVGGTLGFFGLVALFAGHPSAYLTWSENRRQARQLKADTQIKLAQLENERQAMEYRVLTAPSEWQGKD
jgi:hypothetical protein